VPIAQDILNPTLKNITERFINLNSQFRQSGSASSTDYVVDLSDHMNDVLTMRLYSFQIPYTWYVLDNDKSLCFWLVDSKTQEFVSISLIPGNYNLSTISTQLNNVMNSVLNSASSVPIIYVILNAVTNKILFQNLPLEYDTIVFFDIEQQFIPYTPACRISCSSGSQYCINNTLGWTLGFRSPCYSLYEGSIMSEAIPDLTGPKYLILVIDDFNQNHLNNGLVSITELSKQLKLPSYYNKSLPYQCYAPDIPSVQSIISENELLDNNQLENMDIYLDKTTAIYQQYPQLIPEAPRILTQSQRYTINEIIKNNDKTTNYRLKAPTTTDVFALIPIKGSMSFGSLYADYGSSLQSFKRVYFGPVNLDRMRISLLDDKGNRLNLNGCDFSITLITENLYQY
jgi:hypothetical protein